MENVKSEIIHCGQYRPYGDFFRIWKITTDEQDIEKVREYCLKELYKKEVPEETEWRKNIQYGKEKYSDANYYFAGYHKLEKKEFENNVKGYIFTICEPYTD